MNLTALSSHQFRALALLAEKRDFLSSQIASIVNGSFHDPVERIIGHAPAKRGRGPWTPAQRRKFKRTMAARSKA